ncbi:erythromycin esterase family protein [Streptomyces sp. NPDC058372]|uniref:erythromycin esterase family protein n=1 Tax=Streptomyces sp. NPDC058372 TaxID=3346464 RepID=UPI003647C2BF
MDTSTAQIVQWLGARAHPLNAADTQAPSGDLAAFVSLVRDRGAEVVAIGVACRQGRELAVVAHRMVRVPVEEAGFRSVASEGDDPAAVGIDGYVRTGEGGPRAMPAGARSFWRSEEILGLVEWMRAYNLRNPADQVRFARPSPGGERGPRLAGMAGIERELAEDTLGWCRRSGDKIVYWGGLAHMAVGEPRAVTPPSPPETHRNAGSFLRVRLGPAYLSVGVTFSHGAIPYDVPPSPEGYLDEVFGRGGPDAYWVDVSGVGEGSGELPGAVAEWLAAPARVRLIGPGFDPRESAAHYMAGRSPGEWFDGVVHVREVTADTPLGGPADQAGRGDERRPVTRTAPR